MDNITTNINKCIEFLITHSFFGSGAGYYREILDPLKWLVQLEKI